MFYWYWLFFYSYDDLLREERIFLQEVIVMENKFEFWFQLLVFAIVVVDVKKVVGVVIVLFFLVVVVFEVFNLYL